VLKRGGDLGDEMQHLGKKEEEEEERGGMER